MREIYKTHTRRKREHWRWYFHLQRKETVPKIFVLIGDCSLANGQQGIVPASARKRDCTGLVDYCRLYTIRGTRATRELFNFEIN